MLFFSEIIGDFNKGFGNLLGLSDKENGEEDNAGDQGENGDGEEEDGGYDAGFIWLSFIKEFSEYSLVLLH